MFGITQISKQGSTPTPWARGLRDQIQKWAAGLRPWSQTMVSKGARPWGRGRSGAFQQISPLPPSHLEAGLVFGVVCRDRGTPKSGPASNNSGQFEGTAHEDVGFRGNKKGQKVDPNFAPNIAMEFYCHAFYAPEMKSGESWKM